MQRITSVDIGNEEIKVIVASAFDNKCNVLASTSIRSSGIKKNTIYNEKKLRESVKLAILKTEEKIGMKIKEVQVEMSDREFGESYLKPLKAIEYMFNMVFSILFIRSTTRKNKGGK